MADKDPQSLLRALDQFEARQQKPAGREPKQMLSELDEYEGRDNGGREVVATTDDGGRVVRMSNGSLAFTSPGYSTTDPQKIERIMQGATPAQEVQRSLDEQRIAENPVAARVQEFNQGAPFVGEWLDEAVGMVSPQAADNMRATSDAMERQHPGQSVGLNVAGGIAYSAPLAIEGLKWVTGGKTKLGTATRGAVAGLLGGGSEGATSEAGRSDPGSRGEGASRGAVVGGGLGAALGAFAPLAAGGVKELARRVKRLDVRSIAEEFGVSPSAARTVKSALENDDIATAAERLKVLGDDAMLADAGPSTQALLDAASKTGGSALATTREAVESRAQAVGSRLPGKLDNILGTAKGVRTAAREIASDTAPARRAAYDRAYNSAIDYSSSGRNIKAVLERVPPRTLKAAVDDANEEMISKGVRNRQIMAEIADDGSVSFREMPNVQQLDEIKQSLDALGRDAVDQFGRPTKQGLRYQRLARDLRDAVSDSVPAYRQALKVGGDKLQRDQALDLGRKLLTRGTDLEDVRDFMAGGVSEEAKTAIRQGLRENIEKTLSNVRRTITDPNTDAREAMQLVKDLSSRENLSKVRMVLGQSRADQLLNELEKQATALSLRGAVARNSDTAIRQSVQGSVRDEAQPGLIRRTLGKGGNPLEAAQSVTETIAGIDPASMSERERAIFAEIADALTRIRGSEARVALDSVRGALRGQPIKDAQAELIGRVVAGSGAATAYQAGRQSLAPR